MIGRLSGRVEWRGADQVLIDVGGGGYVVHVSERTLAALPGVGGHAVLYTDLLVREDLLQLFGFATLQEKELHRLLTSVQGIGARASQAILGALGAEGVSRAIALGDWAAVKAAPGVGPKLAQRPRTRHQQGEYDCLNGCLPERRRLRAEKDRPEIVQTHERTRSQDEIAPVRAQYERLDNRVVEKHHQNEKGGE